MSQLSTAVAWVDFGQAFTAFTSLATHPTHDALRRSVEGHGVATLAASDEHKRLLDKYKAAITTQIALFRQIHCLGPGARLVCRGKVPNAGF